MPAWLLLPLLLLVAAGCGSSAEQEAADSASITAALEAYLPVLGEAYADGEIERLRPYAAEKELARIHALVQDMVDQGRYLVPEFKSLAIEELETWNNSNAFVTTVENWDLRLYALGSSQLLSEHLDQSYRVQYQLKRGDEGWRVLFRGIQE